MSPRLAVGDVSIAIEGSAPCPPGNTTSPPNEGAFAPPGAEGFAVAPGAANTAAPTSAASTSKRVIRCRPPETVLPNPIQAFASRTGGVIAAVKILQTPRFSTDESISRVEWQSGEPARA